MYHNVVQNVVHSKLSFPDCKLLFTDTDSLYYLLTGNDLDKTLKKDQEIFDFSNYTQDHDNFNIENKMVPGKFKDEVRNKIILEFVGLRAEIYSILL